MLYFLDIWAEIGSTIDQGFRSLTGRIAAVLYSFIADLYSVFMYVARAQVLNESYVQNIYKRVGFILGLFMIFRLAFSLIQSLVDPSKLGDKKNGIASVITRSIISIVLLGITPSIFKAAFDFQNLIVGSSDDSDNIIYKIIVANDVALVKSSSFGNTIATELFFCFFKENWDNSLSEDRLQVYSFDDVPVYRYEISNYNDIKKSVKAKEMSFDDVIPLLSKRSDGKYNVDWNPLFSIGVAIIIIWILINYCISVATRVIQLAYLQVVAPIPILSYIGNPDGAFKNWIKQCTTTYLDLFLRLAVIYFIMKLCQDLFALFDNDQLLLSTGLSKGSSEYRWVVVFLIIGLLMFGKRVPELLKELFPQKGGAASLGLGAMSPKKLLSSIPGGKTALGVTRGAATLGAGIVAGGVAGAVAGVRYGEGLRGKIAGFGGGLFRGAASARTKGNVIKNAGTGVNNVRVANERAYQRHHDGSTFFGRMAPLYAQRALDDYERELQTYKDYNDVAASIDKELEKNAYVQEAIARRDALLNREATGGPAATAAEIASANKMVNEYKETALQSEMTKIYNKSKDANSTLARYLSNAEMIRAKGKKENYTGFGSNDVTFDASEFYNNKKSTKSETSNIADVSGKRNKDYKEAKANSAYGKKGK